METEKKTNFTIPTFNNSIIQSFVYFTLLITIIVIIFSSSYINISLILTLFFLYLFFSQLYKFFISKEKNYFSIILSSFIICVLLIINFIIPNDNSILENINNPNMNGTIIVILYTTVIYSLIFMFSLVYSTYKENKDTIFLISIVFIILYLIYIVYFNYVSSPSSLLVYILITIPFFSSIIFILYRALDSIKIQENSFLNGTSFQELLENPTYVSPTQNGKKDDIIHIILKYLLCLYLIIFGICFIIFLTSTSEVINKCEVSEYILYIINGLLIMMLFSITINMTNYGLNFTLNPNLVTQILTVTILIIYNIFISKNLNDSCYEFIKNNASIVTGISYIITFYMYYKIIFNNCKIGEDPILLIYFIILILLFIIVVFNINSSKLSTESFFNDYINIYIYTVIGYASFFTGGFILIFINKFFSLNNKFINDSIGPKEEFIKNTNKIFYYIIGFYILFSIISWISELGKSLYLKHSLNATTIIINLCIIIVNMAILFKLISYSSFYQNSPLLQVVIGSVFYIPCMLVSLLDYINGYYNNNKQLLGNKIELKNFQMNRTDIILLIFIIILYIIYFTYPMIYTKISSQDGKLLLKEPIYLNKEKLLATHEFLSITDNTNPSKEIHPYNYALSFWVYIDSNSSINSNNNYYSILNYGYNPNIKYRGSDNTFIVSLNNKNKNDKYFLYDDNYELDNEYNIIIYKTNKLLLQKWNNIIINYNGSILDIFINGILEKSFKEIIPYMKSDNITIGSENGIHAGICNIVYFVSSLTLEKISYIYNSVKLLNPPILLNYYDRLYMSSLQIENVTYDIGLKQVDSDKKSDYVK
jgi:hypothetical protein